MNPLFLVGFGALVVAGVTIIAERVASASGRDSPPDYPPDPARGKTGYKFVDKILPELRAASQSSTIPLGLLVGWVAKESGGRLEEWGSSRTKPTKYDERGYFQLTPEESAGLGIDHRRLSQDPVYSINAGLLLIGKYMKQAEALGVAPRGSEYFWRLVKLGHAMGVGATKIIVEGARAVGQAGSWEALKQHAMVNEAHYFKMTKHSPSKWFPLVDRVFEVGAPFGVGSGGATQVVGAEPAFNDIPDPLDALDRLRS